MDDLHREPMELDTLIRDALHAPSNSTGYVLNEGLQRAFPNAYVFMTQGFSYAYVKELMLSSLMKWVSERGEGDLMDVVRRQVEGLASQMQSAPMEMKTRFVEEWSDDMPGA